MKVPVCNVICAVMMYCFSMSQVVCSLTNGVLFSMSQVVCSLTNDVLY